MVRPLRVMVTGKQQAMLTAAVVMTSDVAAGTDTAPVKATTDEAVARGVFGAPTSFVGDMMFFGNDRMPLVKAALEAA